MEYERSLTAEQTAQYVLNNCFFINGDSIYLNYSQVFCIYYICHLLCLNTKDTIPKVPYRYLEPDDIKSLYLCYQAIANQEYNLCLDPLGVPIVVPFNQDIEQSTFTLIADTINLIRI